MNTTTLDKIANIYNGNSINADYKKKHFTGLETGYPFIATKDVSFNGVVNYDNGVKIPFETEYKTAEPGSVFICAEGGSAGRKIAYITEKVCFGNKLFCLQPKDGKYNGRYLYYYLMSDTFQTQFKLMLTGLIGGVSAKKFKSFTIPVLPIEDQERIVALLDDQFAKIDALKANAASQLQAAKDLFQSALKELLTPKEGWDEKKLVEVVSKIVDGSHNPPKGIKESEYKMLSSRNIENANVLGQADVRFLSKEDFEIENKRTKAKVDDVVLTIVGTIGRSAVLSEKDIPVTFQRSVAIMSPKDGVSSRYLMYYFISNASILNKEAQGVAQKGIYLNQLKNIPISLPSLTEQERIAARLDTISEKVKALQANYDQTITLCNDLKQSLLKSIFA